VITALTRGDFSSIAFLRARVCDRSSAIVDRAGTGPARNRIPKENFQASGFFERDPHQHLVI
jgi:hypothetical protein